ncbi:hypothetical protein [Vreelandella sedimenti]|jgi:hypothetical protein|uniref:hypothetical protein n=1 Tax=Vreelandella sedimenti TaxID=2729618 RepID=UPI00257F911E|nr:hypothetical protein [Halomonas sp. UBA3173]|tara:strand:+ start:11937 stop:12968 length:1032 start_codon:yes stop_codon:yes gene_type:complete
MGIVSLSQKKMRVEINEFELENQVVFEYFNKLPAADRDEKLTKAIYIGILALMEDRMSAFLAKTSNELGTELESLKLIFDMKQEIFYKSSLKGVAAEEDIADFLSKYFRDNNLKDEVFLTGGSQGLINKNKTGDIVCHVNGRDDLKIVIECKFDKNIRLGDIKDKEVFTNKTDTVWSQLIEAQANRDGKIGLLVLDISSVDGVLLREIQNVRFIPEIGFVAIVDSQKGDYSSLIIAYILSRDIAINSQTLEPDKELLKIIVNRLIKDINDASSIKKLVKSNIDNNKKILYQLEKSMLMMDFNMKFLTKFLSDGTLSKKDLLDFYFGDEVKEKYKLIEQDIKNI